ncbi:MAG: family 43 glycosylhydrolase [Clostridia bacterium]|nr:family 43 glycosylhydrolase [Clostridia bacterium]
MKAGKILFYLLAFSILFSSLPSCAAKMPAETEGNEETSPAPETDAGAEEDFPDYRPGKAIPADKETAPDPTVPQAPRDFSEDVKIYVDQKNGKSSGTGERSDPVNSLERAYAKANASAAPGAALVLLSDYTQTASYTAPAHEKPVTLTSENGAALRFNGAFRYYLGGETTFERITLSYQNTLNVVCGFHPVRFGEGVETVNLGSGEGVYVVGGLQSPASVADPGKNSSITVESGEFFAVIGGSRQRASGADHFVFTGTNRITVTGGSIKKLYGANVSAHYGQNAVITVTGGKIKELYAAGDSSRRLNGTALLTLSGGEAETLTVNNVVGRADVYLLGTKVDSLSVGSANAEVKKLTDKENRPRVLHLDASYYTKEEIDLFSESFDALESRTLLYAKEGGTGTGRAPEDPTSYRLAFEIAARAGGTVRLLGAVNAAGYEEPAHSYPVTVEGADGSASLAAEGYRLAGETTFSSLTLSGSLDARAGIFTAARDLTTEGTVAVSGNARLRGGRFALLAPARSVLIDGAAVDRIVGSPSKCAVEIRSGQIGELLAAENGTGVFSLVLSGGEVGRAAFDRIGESLYVKLAGGSIGAASAEGTEIRGTLILKNGASASLLGDAAALFDVKEEHLYYLRDGGTGDGSTAESAGPSLSDAYQALRQTGGTVVLCGPYTARSFKAPSHRGKIVITSLYEGVDYAAQNGAMLLLPTDFTCGGETEFSFLTIASEANYISIYGANHALLLGRGITCLKTGSVTTYPSVMGGARAAYQTASSDLTIQSGSWQRVRGGSAVGGSKNYTVRLTVDGGAFYERLTLADNGAHDGDVTATVNGGTFYQGICAASLSAGDRFSGKVDLTINGGVFYATVGYAASDAGSYSGSYRVTINGGDFAHLTDLEGGERFGVLSTLTGSLDRNAPVSGTMTFQNPVHPNGADPWLFEHGGFYWYVSTQGGGYLTVRKAANIGDLPYATSKIVYQPESGKPWSNSMWSPEIHYYTDEEIGEGNGGWYCYIAAQAAGDGNNHQMYVLKCLDGDNFFGRWGNPVTGEVNVPQPVAAPDMEEFPWAAGETDVRINGQLYNLYVTVADSGKPSKHQTINIVRMTNPWTLKGEASVICVPDYDWEMHGYYYDPIQKTYMPRVVEGATAVYADDGTVYLIYSGSGYWTVYYQLGQLKYVGGDPLEKSSWEKRPTPILSLSEEVNGCGHASYFTDLDGQRWICYHAYIGKDTSSGRYAFVEPYTADKNGVVIGSGSEHPAPLDTEYTVKLNPMPLSEKIGGFTD